MSDAARRHRRRRRRDRTCRSAGHAAEHHLLPSRQAPSLHALPRCRRAGPAASVLSIQRIVRRWIDEGYLECKGGTPPAMVTYLEIADKAAERIYAACQRAMGKDKSASRRSSIPTIRSGSTAHVSFNTSKDAVDRRRPTRCHVNYVVCDSEWEAELARVVEAHPRVKAYVKNQGLQFGCPIGTARCRRNICRTSSCRLTMARHGRPLNLVVETKGYRGLRRAAEGRDDGDAMGAGREQSRHVRPLGFRGVPRRLSRSRRRLPS